MRAQISKVGPTKQAVSYRQWYKMSINDIQSVLQTVTQSKSSHQKSLKKRTNNPEFISKPLWPFFYYMVTRGTKRVRVPINQLRVGDTVEVTAGDIVPAVIRLTQCRSLAVDESACFGSHVPAYKNTFASSELVPETAQKNMLFPASSIIKGSGKGIVVEPAQNFPYNHLIKSKKFTKMKSTFPVVSSIKNDKQRLKQVSFVVFDGIGRDDTDKAVKLLLHKKGISVAFFGLDQLPEVSAGNTNSVAFMPASATASYHKNVSESDKIALVKAAQRQGHMVLYVGASGSVQAHLAANINILLSPFSTQATMLKADIVVSQLSPDWLDSILYNKK